MPDAPDPLGKRALYWAPAERQEEGPRTAEEGNVPGKHALYSNAGSPDRRLAGPMGTRPIGAVRPAAGKAGHPSNPPLLTRDPGPEARGTAARGAKAPDDLDRPLGSGMFGTLTLHCSSCRVRSHVDLVEFLVLHLPLWLWRPGRGYTRFMTCPACRRRTWVSASWTSWSR